MILDHDGSHANTRLAVPDDITLLLRPPRSPELNPVENIWQFMRDDRLFIRVFDGSTTSTPCAARRGTSSAISLRAS